MHDQQLKQLIEAALFAAEAPLSVDQLKDLLAVQQISKARIQSSLTELQQDYQNRGVQLQQVASGYRFQTRTELGSILAGLWQENRRSIPRRC